MESSDSVDPPLSQPEASSSQSRNGWVQVGTSTFNNEGVHSLGIKTSLLWGRRSILSPIQSWPSISYQCLRISRMKDVEHATLFPDKHCCMKQQACFTQHCYLCLPIHRILNTVLSCHFHLKVHFNFFKSKMASLLLYVYWNEVQYKVQVERGDSWLSSYWGRNVKMLNMVVDVYTYEYCTCSGKCFFLNIKDFFVSEIEF